MRTIGPPPALARQVDELKADGLVATNADHAAAGLGVMLESVDERGNGKPLPKPRPLVMSLVRDLSVYR